MQPLVQWQKISFAQAAALTWSISRFSFLGRGERDLIQKCLGMAYIGCSRWFKRRPEFSSISKYVCVCICVCMCVCVCVESLCGSFCAWQFISEVLFSFFSDFFVLSIAPPYLWNLTPSSLYLFLKFLHPFTTFTDSTVSLLSNLFPPLSSPLSLPLSPTSILDPLSLSALARFPALPSASVALYSQRAGPMDSESARKTNERRGKKIRIELEGGVCGCVSLSVRAGEEGWQHYINDPHVFFFFVFFSVHVHLSVCVCVCVRVVSVRQVLHTFPCLMSRNIEYENCPSNEI